MTTPTMFTDGDLIWYDAKHSGAYGHIGKRIVPAIFRRSSKSGKRVYIDVVDFMGRHLPLYVLPEAITTRTS